MNTGIPHAMLNTPMAATAVKNTQPVLAQAAQTVRSSNGKMASRLGITFLLTSLVIGGLIYFNSTKKDAAPEGSEGPPDQEDELDPSPLTQYDPLLRISYISSMSILINNITSS